MLTFVDPLCQLISCSHFLVFCLLLRFVCSGKTTVARLYGRILKSFGILTNGDVIEHPASDFIGSALGQSEAQTKAILASADGKVLLIDEAYNLNPAGSSKLNGSNDPYREGAVNTLVERIQNVPGENRCVLMLGYRDDMERFLRDANPGLKRRFALEDAFEFEDYTADQLMHIMRKKLKDRGLNATPTALMTAIDVLEDKKRQPNFGNGGDVENLITAALTRMQSRLRSSAGSLDTLEPCDFDPRSGQPIVLDDLFEGLIGCDHLIGQLRSLETTINYQRSRGKDPFEHLPMNFVFAGPPGTGTHHETQHTQTGHTHTHYDLCSPLLQIVYV